MKIDRKRLCIIVQRAMKAISGYFGGYISKRQKVGQFELRASVKALPLLSRKLRDREFKASSAQLAHIVNRMFTTLEGKGILRTAPEEFMLSSLYKSHDPLAAEFFRTCRHELFFGRQYLQLYESLQGKETTREVTVLVRKHRTRTTATDAQSLYGFRPQHSDTWYLSPWEFCQWFKGVALKRPSEKYAYSK